jgi:hypothetical protein
LPLHGAGPRSWPREAPDLLERRCPFRCSLRWRARTRDPGFRGVPYESVWKSQHHKRHRDRAAAEAAALTPESCLEPPAPILPLLFPLSSFPILLDFYFYFYFLVEQQRLTTRANSRRRFTCGVSLNPPRSLSFFFRVRLGSPLCLRGAADDADGADLTCNSGGYTIT